MELRQLTGRIGNVELKYVGDNNTALCKFSVAENHYNRETGDYDITVWTDCALWGKRGESFHEKAEKGRPIMVGGSMEYREYDGNTYETLQVDQWKWLDFGGGKNATKTNGQKEQAPEPVSEPSDSPFDTDDDLPF